MIWLLIEVLARLNVALSGFNERLQERYAELENRRRVRSYSRTKATLR
jgi:hypothetical protein